MDSHWPFWKGGRVLYLHSDHLGTPRVATDETGTVVWRWQSDAFGATPPDEDPDGDGRATVVNLRFLGQYADGKTGLYYNYFRYCDPQTGRYISSDPIGLQGGLNTYGYVGGNPLIYADFNGLVRWSDAGVAILSLIGNGAGMVFGAGLLAAPEPTLMTKAVGFAVLGKSTVGWGLNWYNLTRALSDDDLFDAPNSAGRAVAKWTCPDSESALRIADAAELSLDFLSGRVVIGSVPIAGSALNKSVNFYQANDYGRIGVSPINLYVDTMQGVQTLQYGYDGYASVLNNN